ncbi:hypothetical protein SMD20_39990 [Nonomuraea sp. LP-02]|uniref:hypothetical protein n=1 Tax=Nonomuraea sp. LP-02 TaxID=3097960 RepID=UPI002E315391|nr:hypothetical protein [Nonomuraea sp. LP-02]MED7930462.1 hypothetical protein [Nonomuraea sp. LP-02]
MHRVAVPRWRLGTKRQKKARKAAGIWSPWRSPESSGSACRTNARSIRCVLFLFKLTPFAAAGVAIGCGEDVLVGEQRREVVRAAEARLAAALDTLELDIKPS